MAGRPGTSGCIHQMPGDGGPGGGSRDNAAGGQGSGAGLPAGTVPPVLPGYLAVVAMGRSWRAVLAVVATRSR
jgi:hypothetical protein